MYPITVTGFRWYFICTVFLIPPVIESSSPIRVVADSVSRVKRDFELDSYSEESQSEQTSEEQTEESSEEWSEEPSEESEESEEQLFLGNARRSFNVNHNQQIQLQSNSFLRDQKHDVFYLNATNLEPHISNNVIKKLFVCDRFQDNIIFVMGYLLRLPDGTLSRHDYVALEIIYNALKQKTIYMYNILPILKNINGKSKSEQFMKILNALAGNLPPYQKCAANFLKKKIDEKLIDINGLLSSTKENLDFLAGINAETIKISSEFVAADELTAYDDDSRLTEYLLGLVYVNLFKHLTVDIKPSQLIVGLILRDLPNADSDPLMEEYMSYIVELTYQNKISNWENHRKKLIFKNPYTLILSIVDTLCRDNEISLQIKMALLYIKEHFTSSCKRVVSSPVAEARQITQGGLDIDLLLEIAVQHQSNNDISLLKLHLREYLLANANQEVKDILAGMNRFKYSTSRDLLLAFLARLKIRLPKDDKNLIIVSSMLSNLLFVMNYRDISKPPIGTITLWQMIDILYEPNMDPEIIKSIADLQSDMIQQVKIWDAVKEQVMPSRRECSRPKGCVSILLQKLKLSLSGKKVPAILIKKIEYLLVYVRKELESGIPLSNRPAEPMVKPPKASARPSRPSKPPVTSRPARPPKPPAKESQLSTRRPKPSRKPSKPLDPSKPTRPPKPVMKPSKQPRPPGRPLKPSERLEPVRPPKPSAERPKEPRTPRKPSRPSERLESVRPPKRPGKQKPSQPKPAGDSSTPLDSPSPSSRPKKPKPPEKRPKPTKPPRQLGAESSTIKNKPSKRPLPPQKPSSKPSSKPNRSGPQKRPIKQRPPKVEKPSSESSSEEEVDVNINTNINQNINVNDNLSEESEESSMERAPMKLPPINVLHNISVLPPNIQPDQCIMVDLRLDDFNHFPTISTSSQIDNALVLPSMVELQDKANDHSILEHVNPTCGNYLKMNIIKQLIKNYGKDFMTTLLGKNWSQKYPTRISALLSLLIAVAKKPEAQKNKNFMMHIKTTIRVLQIIAPYMFLPMISRWKQFDVEVIWSTINTRQRTETVIGNAPPPEKEADTVTLPLINPMYWLLPIDSNCDPFPSMLPQLPSSNRYSNMLRPLMVLFKWSQLTALFGKKIRLSHFPNRGALFLWTLHRLRRVEAIRSKAKLLKLIQMYLQVIQQPSLYLKIPKEVVLDKVQTGYGSWTVDLVGLMKALPKPRSQPEKKMWQSLVAFFSRINLLEDLAIPLPPKRMTCGKFLALVIKTALSTKKIVIDEQTRTALLYYQDKISFSGLGAENIVWVWFQKIIVESQKYVGEIIENLLPYEKLARAEQQAYNNLVVYLYRHPEILTMKDFPVEQCKTTGSFVRSFFEHLLKKPDVDRKVKQYVSQLLPHVILEGPGAKSMPSRRSLSPQPLPFWEE